MGLEFVTSSWFDATTNIIAPDVARNVDARDDDDEILDAMTAAAVGTVLPAPFAAFVFVVFADPRTKGGGMRTFVGMDGGTTTRHVVVRSRTKIVVVIITFFVGGGGSNSQMIPSCR